MFLRAQVSCWPLTCNSKWSQMQGVFLFLSELYTFESGSAKSVLKNRPRHVLHKERLNEITSSSYLHHCTSSGVQPRKPALARRSGSKADASSQAKRTLTAEPLMVLPMLMPCISKTASPRQAKEIEAAARKAAPSWSNVRTHQPRDHDSEPTLYANFLDRCIWITVAPCCSRKDLRAHAQAIETLEPLQLSKAWSTSAEYTDSPDRGQAQRLHLIVAGPKLPRHSSRRRSARSYN